MASPSSLEELFRQFTANMPQGMKELQADMEKNMRVALDATLQRMNLVTQAEFDLQSEVLQRTRERLEILEARVAELEARQNPSPAPESLPTNSVG